MSVPPPPPPGRSAAPTVAYGPGAVHRVPAIAERSGARRVLLVCGRTSFEASGAAEMLPALERVAAVRRWSGFRPNTDSADLAVGLDVVREHRPDLVVAVGGGSTLDMAKLLVGYHDVAPEEVVTAIRSGRGATSRSARLLLAPTTSGSGAEATHFAVVYVGDDKHSIAGPAMRADAIVLDPSLTLSGSHYQRATSGIDAVAQAIESLWATCATERSRRFARHAVRLLLPAIRRFVDDADGTAARGMAIGSHLAGRAIDVSRTTAAHALSYGLTKGYGVSHGHAVAVTLGAFIEWHGRPEGMESLQPTVDPGTHADAMRTIVRMLGASDPAGARARFERLVRDLGLDVGLAAVGAGTPADRERLVAGVNVERLGNNPVRFGPDELEELLRSVT